jgi:hypothetical protein
MMENYCLMKLNEARRQYARASLFMYPIKGQEYKINFCHSIGTWGGEYVPSVRYYLTNGNVYVENLKFNLG